MYYILFIRLSRHLSLYNFFDATRAEYYRIGVKLCNFFYKINVINKINILILWDFRKFRKFSLS